MVEGRNSTPLQLKTAYKGSDNSPYAWKTHTPVLRNTENPHGEVDWFQSTTCYSPEARQ